MKKFISGKVSIAALVFSLLLVGAFLLGNTATNVLATRTTDRSWSAGSWGACVSNGPQCGTDNGTQSRNQTCTYHNNGNDNCSLGTWVESTYKCDVHTNIHGTDYDVSGFYNKPTGDDNHCHRINWGDLGSTKQNDFKLMHHNDHDYSSPNHGNWDSAYNGHITQNPNATVDVAGHYINPETKVDTQSCHTGTIRYDSCTPAGTCPTACGQAASQVPNGRGGFTSCPATDSCPSPVDCAYHYSECSATCGTGTKNLIIDTAASNGGVACPTDTTISCGELPVCEIDQCNNIDENQSTVPDNYYQTEDGQGLSCFAKTATCNDITANNYNELTDTTYSDNSLCSYTVDLCTNIDGVQTSVPDGLHINATGVECVAFGTPGVETPTTSTSTTTGEVLGASIDLGSGQVLGASTMAGTGTFAENANFAIMGLGALSTILGIKGVKKASKKA